MRLLKLPPSTTVIHGAAPGADTIAGWLAEAFGFQIESYPADWEKHGRRAGPIRNRAMLDTHPELVIGFWNGRSRGTKHTLTEARRRGIPVEVITSEPLISK